MSMRYPSDDYPKYFEAFLVPMVRQGVSGEQFRTLYNQARDDVYRRTLPEHRYDADRMSLDILAKFWMNCNDFLGHQIQPRAPAPRSANPHRNADEKTDDERGQNANADAEEDADAGESAPPRRRAASTRSVRGGGGRAASSSSSSSHAKPLELMQRRAARSPEERARVLALAKKYGVDETRHGHLEMYKRWKPN